MEKELYKSLTTEDKINLLHYERGSSALVRLEQYEGTKENPEPTPRPSKLYISNVLDIDFDAFYGDQANMDKSMKFKKEMADLVMPMVPSGYKSPFIGDALCDVLFNMTHLNMTHHDDGRFITENLMKEIDIELLKLYNGFMGLGAKYEPIEGLVVGGHQAYRRVK